MYAYHENNVHVSVLKNNHHRSHTLYEFVTCMSLKLDQIASLLDEGDLHGEQLGEVIAQVDDIKWQRGCIIDLLRQCTARFPLQHHESRLTQPKGLEISGRNHQTDLAADATFN